VAAKGLEKRLKAAVDSAPEDSPVDLDVANPRGALNLARGRAADEKHLDPLRDQLFRHRPEAKAGQPQSNPWNRLCGT
jgi:hypothetical protein